jgi:hypothetical protein
VLMYLLHFLKSGHLSIRFVEWSGDKDSSIGVQFKKPVSHIAGTPSRREVLQEFEVAMDRIKGTSDIPESDELCLLSHFLICIRIWPHRVIFISARCESYETHR